MNIKRVAIVKGLDPENNKKVIERIVIFYDNGSCETQEYNRDEHLRLVAKFLNNHGLDVLNDGLIEGVRNGLLSIVSKDDLIAMEALNRDVLEANIENVEEVKETPAVEEEKTEEVEEIKEEKEEEKEVRRIALSDEFRELARYFRLSILRNDRELTEDEKAELDEIVARNDRASAIEETRNQFLNGNISEKSYEKVVAVHRAALKDAIVNVKLNEDKESDVEVEAEKRRMPISEEYRELADYLRALNDYNRKVRLNEQKVLPPVGQKQIPLLAEQIKELAAKNERVAALEETRAQFLAGNISEKSYIKEYQTQRMALAEEIKRVAALNANKEEKAELSPEFKEVLEYRRKNILRDNGALDKEGEKVIEELAAKNERVAKLENARNEFLAGTLSEDKYEEVVEEQKRDLAEENRRVERIKKEAEAANREEVIIPEEPKAEEAKEETSEVVEENKEVTPVVTPVETKAEEVKVEEDTNKNPENSENTLNRRMNRRQRRAERFANRNNENILVKPFYEPYSIPAGEDLSDEEKAEEPVAEEKKEEGIAPNNEEKSFVLVDPPVQKEEKEEEVLPSKDVRSTTVVDTTKKEEEEPAKTTEVGGLPIVINRNQPEGKVEGKIEEDESEIEEEEIAVDPIIGEGTVSDPKKPATSTVKVRKRGRVIAAIVAALVGLPLVGVLFDRLLNKNNNTNTLPETPAERAAMETPENTQAPVVADNTVAQDNSLENDILAYGSEYGIPQETLSFLFRGEVRAFLEQFKDPAQRKEVISALAFGYEMNILCTKEGNLRYGVDGEPILKSFAYDFICAKAFVNGYTPEQIAAAFGTTDITYDRIMDGYHGFYNMLSTYSIYGTEMPPFRYLTNGENKNSKTLEQIFTSLAVVNANRKAGKLSTIDTDNFIVTVDKAYGRGSGIQFATEGGACLAMAMVDAYTYGQASIANGEALILHETQGLSPAGLTLGAIEDDGRWEKDGYNYNDLYTQINRDWGNPEAADSRCFGYRQRLNENVEKARAIVSGDNLNARLDFADSIDDYEELNRYAEQIRRGNYDQSTLDAISAIAAEKYPHLLTEVNAFVASQGKNNGTLISIDEWAPQVDAFFGLGLRDDYSYEEVMAYYVNRAMNEAMTTTLYGPDGKPVKSRRPQGTGTHNPGTPSQPSVPAPEVTTETHEEQVEWEDLTPEEQQEAQEQIDEIETQQDQDWEQQQEQAQQTADEVTQQLHDGDITPEQAVQQLEEAGIDVDPDYIGTMEQIHQEEEQAAADAQAEADAANAREQEAARQREEEQRRQQEEQRRQEEEAIQQSQQQQQPDPEPAPAPDPDPEPSQPEQQEEQPEQQQEEQQEEHPEGYDPEIDPELTQEDEQPYTGSSKLNLEELRALANSLNDFGMEDRGRSYTL